MTDETTALDGRTAVERAKALALFTRLTDALIPCTVKAKATIADGGLVFIVEVSQAGTDVDEAMQYAPSNDFRCVMGIAGIEFHVIPMDKGEE